MSITQLVNSKANIKKFSDADFPMQPRQPVIARYSADSTASQTVINLPWTVDTVNAQDSFFLCVDGKILTLGSANDYTMTNIDVLGFSNQATLTSSILAGLNIQAWKLGLKKESEFAQDQRFVNAYEYLDKGFQGFVDQSVLMTATTATGAPAAGTFHSTVVGRASMVDLSQDLKPRMGIERLSNQNIYPLQTEFGPNGETVFATQNDTLGQMRFIGNWVNAITVSGNTPAPTSTTDYSEITFYGTGLNLLAYTSNSPDWKYSIDGAAEVSFFNVAASNIILSRNYTANVVIPVIAGLSLGIHTVKIRANTNPGSNCTTGFEILNESSSVKTNPGIGYNQGKKVTTSAQASSLYNDVATGTKGGRVVMYQSSTGVISKAWQAVDATSQTLASADHTNEEVARTYHWREFGAGRTDDFSNLPAAASARAFTLDDGTTTLVCSQAQTGSPAETIVFSAGGFFVTFTFVGTGLDIIRADNGNGAANNNYIIDGTTYALADTGSTTPRKQKVVSGLPYGTHTCKITTNSGIVTGVQKFIVYQPKKPTLPAGAIELADYNVMADYVAAASAAVGSIGTGVLRKLGIREMLYVGTFPVITLDINSFDSGWNINTTTPASYWEYTFFGTGVVYGGYVAIGTANSTILVDGLALNAGSNIGSTVGLVQVGTGLTLSPAGVFGGAVSVAGHLKASISGLPLGKHTIRVTQNTTPLIYMDYFGIITPIHSPKSNLYGDLQNTLPVGSCAISDNRKTTPNKNDKPSEKAWAQAIGVASAPTTTSTSPVPMPDMSVTIKTNGGSLKISYAASVRGSNVGQGYFTYIYVNGVVIKQEVHNAMVSNSYLVQSDSIIVPVSAGVHKVDIYWSVGAGTMTNNGTDRSLTVEEK